jgi:hypothetical protein
VIAGEKRLCHREGCEQPVSESKPGNRYSSFACRAVDYELRGTRRLCTAIGPASTAAGELWAAAVALSDALSEYQRLDRELFSFAQSVGITPDQWYPIKRNPESRRGRR